MSLTRREFTAAAGSAIALTVLGCSQTDHDQNQVPPAHRIKLAQETFTIGSPHQYREAGVYTDYRDSHGVWVVSNGHMLVVLSAVCTHKGCGTRYDTTTNKFKCPCYKSRFTTDGLVVGDSHAKRALERCRIDLIAGQLHVDPTRRFRQDLNEWSSKFSLYLYDS